MLSWLTDRVPLGSQIGQIGRWFGQWWKRQHWLLQAICVLLMFGLGLRGTAYLQPVRVVDLAQVDQAVAFSDRYGQSLGTLLSRDQEHTAVVPLDQVSPHFIRAILAAEDQRFYRHGPVDLQAVVRASLQTLKHRQIVSGASTITMQLARMVDPVPRTPWGKVQQVWKAWRIDAGMDKDAILAAYINRLPMGGNIYGVEAASRGYFGVPATDLTVSQASLLAALPNAPTALNPYTHWDALKQRQRYVLRRLTETGYLTPAQAERVAAQTVTLQPPGQDLLAAPHFLFWLAANLPPDHPAQVQTTLNLQLQRFVEAQVRQAIKGLVQHQVHQAAAIVIDNKTGGILAYVGSPGYFTSDPRDRNDGVQALRQPGSALKPFLYELALERQVIHPNTILQDVPTHYPIPGAHLYSPTDYSNTFQGPVRVRAALANSLNVPAVRVLEKVGVPTFLERLHQLGFQHLDHSPDYYGLGLALGSGEVSLWELAQAYLILSLQGDPQIHLSPTLAEAVPFPLNPSPPTHAPTWALITDMLSDRYARATSFGVDSVLNLPFPAAVKTGTSSDYRDTWTAGFTTDYTVATWVGNFDGSPMRQVSGVTGAAPLWHRIMVHLHEQQEPAALASPAGMVKRPICAVTGQKPGPDCDAIVQEYFAPGDLLAYGQEPAARATSGQTPETPPANLTGLQIRSPAAGSRFLLYPDQGATGSQRLELAIAPPPTPVSNTPIEWRLNGQPLEAHRQTSLFWPMQPGHWTLEVRQGDQQDQVQFDVDIATDQPTRRGFSVVGQTPPSP